MSSWQVRFTAEGEKDFNRLNSAVKKRVVSKLHWLEKNFDSIVPEPLHYNLKNFYKLRVGLWRVVYEIDFTEMFLIVHRIEPRDKVYKI